MISRLLKTKAIIFMLQAISSCGGGYSAHFNCPDATGYGCTAIDVIDRRISSGQIEELNNAKAKKHCKGSRCKIRRQQEMKPELKEQSRATVEFMRDKQ